MTDPTIIPGSAPLTEPVFEARHLIDGTWQTSANDACFERASPAHLQTVTRAALADKAETEAAIGAARRAFDDGRWSRLSGKARATLLLKVADLIERDIERIALRDTLESGKPIGQARDEISGAADIWRYAASLARTLSGDSHNSLGDDMLGLVLKEPVGVAAMITPWNFPFLVISQKLPFALAAGCTAVVKPSELTPGSTVILGELLIEAGLPDGVVNIVLGYGDPVGTTMCESEQVDMISFTGSTGVGKAIVRAAAGTLKRVSLELGGKNPQVVFPDCDLDEAADAIVFGVYFNAGECCNSGSRIIVHEDVADVLTEKVVALSKKVAFGDPLAPQTKVGAIISEAHFAKIDGYVEAARQAGAEISLGGGPLEIPGLSGRFYAPTVVTKVNSGMPIAREEVFGPVLTVLSFKSIEEAIELANNAAYGLSASVWSDDVHTCLAFARRVQAGTVWTNTFMDGFSELPFGGVKQSGLGRELGRYGIEEYLEMKTVTMRIGATRSSWVN